MKLVSQFLACLCFAQSIESLQLDVSQHRRLQVSTNLNTEAYGVVPLGAVTYPRLSRAGSAGLMQHLTISVRAPGTTQVGSGIMLDTGSSGLAICPGLIDLTSPRIRNTGKKGCTESGFGGNGTVYEGDLELTGGYVLKNVTFIVLEHFVAPFCAKTKFGGGGWGGIFGAANLPTNRYCGTASGPIPAPLYGEESVGVSWNSHWGENVGKLYLGGTAQNLCQDNEAFQVPMLRDASGDSDWTVASHGWKVFNQTSTTTFPPFIWNPVQGSCVLFDTGTPTLGAPQEVLASMVELEAPYKLFSNTSTLELSETSRAADFHFNNLGPILKHGNCFGAIGGGLSCQVMGLPFFMFYNTILDRANNVMKFCKAAQVTEAMTANYLGQAIYPC